MSSLIRLTIGFLFAGARGMAGSAICRALQAKGYGDRAKGGALLTPVRQTGSPGWGGGTSLV